MTHKEAKKQLLKDPEVAAEYALAAYRHRLTERVAGLKKPRIQNQLVSDPVNWNAALDAVLKLIAEEEK